jgi:hypothetical protein
MPIPVHTRRVRCLAVLLFAALLAPAAAPFKESTMDDKEPLAALVEPVDANQARLIRDPRTTVTRLPTSFLRDALIFRFDWWGPYKIVAGTIGYTRHDNAIYFLAGSAENFDRLIANARVMIDTDEQRLSYAMTRLEATRSFARTYLVLERFEDMKLLPDAPPEAQARARDMRTRYAPLITPPHVEADGPGWRVSVFVLSEDNLCLDTVLIARDGTSRVERTVLEAHTLMLPN